MHPQSQLPHTRARQVITYSLLTVGLLLFAYFGFNGFQNASNWQVVTGKPRLDIPQVLPTATVDNMDARDSVAPPIAAHAQAIPTPVTSNEQDSEISKKEEVADSKEIKYVEVVESKSTSSSVSSSNSNSRTVRQ